MKGHGKFCTVEAQTGTCMRVEWFMIENVTNINLSSRTSLTTIPIYVTWWLMERKWKQSGSLVCMYCSVSVCMRLPTSIFLKVDVLTEHFVCSASFKLALDALPQLHSGADKKWVSHWAVSLKWHLDSEFKHRCLCTGYVQLWTTVNN